MCYSSANRYIIKYINMKDRDVNQANSRRKRNEGSINAPIHFIYTSTNNQTTSEFLIAEPEVLKEQCVPNVTKTCMTLYVFCEQTLFTNFHADKNLSTTLNNFAFPWIAKVYVDGFYHCTGVLIDPSWVVVSQSCLWNTL